MQTAQKVEVGADEYGRMKQAEAELEKLRDELNKASRTITDLENQVDAISDENTGLEEEVSELRGELQSAEWETEDEIRELAKARTALMNGKCDEGRDMLERVLDRAVGDKWRLFC